MNPLTIAIIAVIVLILLALLFGMASSRPAVVVAQTPNRAVVTGDKVIVTQPGAVQPAMVAAHPAMVAQPAMAVHPAMAANVPASNKAYVIHRVPDAAKQPIPPAKKVDVHSFDASVTTGTFGDTFSTGPGCHTE